MIDVCLWVVTRTSNVHCNLYYAKIEVLSEVQFSYFTQLTQPPNENHDHANVLVVESYNTFCLGIV